MGHCNSSAIVHVKALIRNSNWKHPDLERHVSMLLLINSCAQICMMCLTTHCSALRTTSNLTGNHKARRLRAQINPMILNWLLSAKTNLEKMRCSGGVGVSIGSRLLLQLQLTQNTGPTLLDRNNKMTLKMSTQNEAPCSLSSNLNLSFVFLSLKQNGCCLWNYFWPVFLCS